MKKGFLKLEDVQAGARVFVDSTIFIYHFTGSSLECKRFLSRCERGDLKAISAVIVLAEVAHRMMMLEAVNGGWIRGSNPARKLRERPDLIKRLQTYQQQIDQIPLMGIEILPLDLKTFLEASVLRRKYGFLTYDSLVAATALEQEVDAIASGDSDFQRLEEVPVFHPHDLRFA